MIRKKIVCENCGKEITLNNIDKHKNSNKCKNNVNRSNLKKMRQLLGIKGSNQYINARLLGIDIPVSTKKGKTPGDFKGKKHSIETKRILSEKALASNHRRLCKSTRTFIKKDGTELLLDSSWEEKLARLLEEKNYNWIRPDIPIVWIDSNNKKHNYFPDFYLIDHDIYLDPKNPAAFKQQIEKIKYLTEHKPNVIFLLNEYEIDNFENQLAVAERSSKPCV